MRNGLIGLAIVGTVALGTGNAALAQVCPAGQIMQAGICRPAAAPGVVTTAPGSAGVVGTVPSNPAVGPRAAGTTTVTTGVAGSSVPPVASSTAGAAAQEKIETCPAGFILYNHGCAPAQHAVGTMVR